MKISNLAAVLLLGLAPLTTAHAADNPGAGRLLQRLDSNGDGVISKDEMLAARERLFSRLDRNGDGVIDQDEQDDARDAIMDRAEAMQAKLGIRMRRLDANGDGKVSAEEFRSNMPLFDLVDRNGDGKLSTDEIDIVRTLIAARRG